MTDTAITRLVRAESQRPKSGRAVIDDSRIIAAMVRAGCLVTINAQGWVATAAPQGETR